jgi:pheromone shutdown protein TraB
MINTGNIHRLAFEDREVTLIGTAHVSRESVDLGGRVIEEERPDTGCVELCQSTYQVITEKNRWQNTDLLKVIREKKAFLLLSNLMLAYFQKRIGQKLGIKPGGEVMRAFEAAETVGARIHMAGRNIRTTLSRTWRLMGLRTKIKLLAQFIAFAGNADTIREEDIEKMKREDVLETLLSEMGESLPEVKRTLIDERDQYLAHRIRWGIPVDIEALTRIPPKGRLFGFLKWAIPVVIVGLIVLGFFVARTATGTHVIKWWVLANAVLAGLGATIALGHPLTILSAVVASP